MRTKLKELIIKIGYRFYKLARMPLIWYWKIFKVQTRGVRVLIFCDEYVLLVRHWYNGLWVMPGGGIKKHETPEQGAVREIQEETGFDVEQLDYKLGEYSNKKEGKNDVVHCFVVNVSEQFELVKKFNIEISDIKWCKLDSLPAGVSKATNNRINEHITKDISKEIRSWS